MKKKLKELYKFFLGIYLVLCIMGSAISFSIATLLIYLGYNLAGVMMISSIQAVIVFSILIYKNNE